MAVEPKDQRLLDAVGGTGAAVRTGLQFVPNRFLHLFRIQTVGYTGTVDIQGLFPPGTSWENVPYVRRAVGTALFSAPSVAQLSFSNSTAVAMIATVEPRRVLSINVDPGAMNAGTITVDVIGVEDDAAILAQTSTGTAGGGAVTIADGADAAEGTTTDAAVVDYTASATVIAALKGLLQIGENGTATVLTSAARTATVSSADQTNLQWRGAHIIINATAKVASPSVVPTVEGKNPLTGLYYTILTGAAVTDAGVTVLKVYPGIHETANVAISDFLPKTWRVTMTVDDTDSLTYSIACNMIR